MQMWSNTGLRVFILLVVVLLGFVFRFSILDRDLMFDDLFSIYYASQPAAEVIQNAAYEVTQVPGYYMILKGWMTLFGSGEVAVRILSVLAGLGSVVVIYFFATAVFSRQVGVLSSVFVSFSSIHILLSEEVRAYTFVTLSALLSLYFFWKYIQTRRSLFLSLYTIVSIFLLYMHLQGWFVIAAQNVFMIIYFKKYNISLARWFVSQTVVVASFVPWLVYAIIPGITSGAQEMSWLMQIRNDYTRFMAFDMPINFALTPKYIGEQFFVLAVVWYGFIVLAFGTAFVTFKRTARFFITISRNRVPERVLLMLLLLIPLLVFLVTEIPLAKYYIVASIPFYIFIAYGISTVFRSRRSTYVAAVIILLNVGLFLPRMLPSDNPYLNAEAITYIQEREQPGDIVIVYHFKHRLYFDYYYHGIIPVVGLFPKNNYADLDEEIARYNTTLSSFISEENIGVLNTMTQSAQRVWYYSSVGEENNVYRADLPLWWFSTNNWKVIEKRPFYDKTVFLLERN